MRLSYLPGPEESLMRLSRRGRELVRKYEGGRERVYTDPTGIPTAGWGKRLSPQDLVRYPVGSVVPLAERQAWFNSSVREAEMAVRQLVKRPLNQNQFDALTSLVYNIGRRRFATSTILQKVNEGDYNSAVAEFGRWTRAGKKVLGGLVSRRQAEAELFSSPGRTDLIPSPSSQIAPEQMSLDIPLEPPNEN